MSTDAKVKLWHSVFPTSQLKQFTMNHPANTLQQGLQALQLDFSPGIQTQILNYLELLAQWNRVYNLTAVREVMDMVPKHVLDSLAILPYIYGTRILDVGTGAGLPGLLLAITRPDWQCVLLDRSAKKIRFVRQAVIELNLENVETVCTRIETFQSPNKFTSIISRAYKKLNAFYTQTARLCATEGGLFAMKGTYPTAELAELAHLPIHLQSLLLQVPQLSAQRHLIIMRPLDKSS